MDVKSHTEIINRSPKKFNVERLRESSIITNYQTRLGKEFEKIKKERAGEELTYVHEEWKQLKEVLVEAAEHSRIPTKTR